MRFNRRSPDSDLPPSLLAKKRALPRAGDVTASNAAVVARHALESRARTTKGVVQWARTVAAAAVPKVPAPSARIPLGLPVYEQLYSAVATEVAQLRVVLEGAEARERERVWLRGQTHGELDDTRLVDGATGEKNIYMRRGVEPPVPGMVQRRPKRLRFVLDISQSMALFNSNDRRLDRTAATALMLMEALQGFGHKYDYSIVGHDGESCWIPLVPFSRPPRTAEEKIAVLEKMYYNAANCASGDTTLAAAFHAMGEVRSEPADDYFVFLLSDANLERYGIAPATLAAVLSDDPRLGGKGEFVDSAPSSSNNDDDGGLRKRSVKTFAIFIAGDEGAEKLAAGLPIGRGYTCQDTTKLPKIFREVFSQNVV